MFMTKIVVNIFLEYCFQKYIPSIQSIKYERLTVLKHHLVTVYLTNFQKFQKIYSVYS